MFLYHSSIAVPHLFGDMLDPHPGSQRHRRRSLADTVALVAGFVGVEDRLGSFGQAG
jgi:hypothetical protein